MSVAEDKGSELHDGDEAGEIEDFGVRIAAVEHARQVEELGTLVDLRPKTLFQGLLGSAEGCSLLNEVKVGEDADNFGEAMRLQDVEELECFLLEGQLQV